MRVPRAGLLPVALALVVGVLTPPAGAADPSGPALSSTVTRPALRSGDAVTLSGAVPPGSTVVGVHVLALGPGGAAVAEQPLGPVLDTAPGPANEYVRVDAGRLDGRLVLRCLFQTPTGNCPHALVTGVTVRLDVKESPDAPLSTNALPIDYVNPEIRQFVVESPQQLRVDWTEPVVEPSGSEYGADWSVTYEGTTYNVLQVGGAGDQCGYLVQGRPATGCTRRLQLDRALPDDALPEADYRPLAVPRSLGDTRTRTGYVDVNDNQYRGVYARTVDGVLPGVPRLVTAAGRTVVQAAARGADPRPEVVVEQVTDGHTVTLYRESGTTDGFQPREDLVLDQQVVASGRATLRPDAPLGPAGSYRLYLTATDRNLGEGAAATLDYLLDTEPLVYSAVSSDRTQTVTVQFTKPVTGSDSPLDWQVQLPDGTPRPVTAVTGSGASRTLSAGAVPARSRVTYRPLPASTPYTDLSGNTVPTTTREVQPVPAPVVLRPAAELLTGADSQVVAGTGAAGTTVEVYADDDGDGVPSGAPLRSSPVVDGAWATEPPLALLPDRSSRWVVLARDAQGAASDPVRVPLVRQDTSRPVLSGGAPAPGTVLQGGARTQLTYSYADANPAPAPVRIELALDGSTYEPLAAGAPADGYSWAVPAVEATGVRLRLTAVDALGRETAGALVLGPYTLDAVAPFFTGRTLDARTVEVVASEDLPLGSSSTPDWRVAGQPVAQAVESRRDGLVTVRLTTAPGVVLQPDDEPVVTYAPALTSNQYQDKARRTVQRRTFPALDGILPPAPAVRVPAQPVLTREDSARASGTGPSGGAVELLDASGVRVAGPVVVGADGTWAADVPLPPDSTTDLQARSVDVHGNRSAAGAAVPTLEQDASDPVVRLSEPAPYTRLAPGSQVAVRWTSTDRNLVDRATTVQASTDGGRTFTVLGDRQPASGSLVWSVPQTVTSDALVLVQTPDRAGRSGRASSAVGIGADPVRPTATPSSSGSPTAGPTASPTRAALPGPLGVSVGPSAVVPGQPSTVTVTGAPGTRVELQAYSRPSTEYRQVRTGTVGADGRVAFPVRPGTNTRLFARALDGSATSRTAVVQVRAALSLTVLRNGRRDYTFQGRILPRRAGQLITLYRVDGGQEVIAAQLRTDSTGTYRLRRVFTGSGRFGFLTRTGQTLTNADGVSGAPRPTDVF